MTKYRCSNDACGAECTSETNLVHYGTCKECGAGFMRRVHQLEDVKRTKHPSTFLDKWTAVIATMGRGGQR
jgi:hypothetical protein